MPPAGKRRGAAASVKPVMSTIELPDAHWRDTVDIHNYASRSPGRPRTMLALWRAARPHDRIILMGAVSARHLYQDLVLAIALKARRPRPRLLISDATWEPRSRSLERRLPMFAALLPLAVRTVVKAVDGPHVHYGVLSSREAETFPKLWGVASGRVVFTPFHATIDADTPSAHGDYLFSGGSSLRDYDLLAEALRGVPFHTVLATAWRPGATDPLAEIDADIGKVPHERFVQLLAGSRAVVIPLQHSVRSAGQQSYLNAMLLRKPVVVTDAPGVRDHIRDGVTGVIVAPQAGALREALLHVMDPANHTLYEEMGRRARADVLERFTTSSYAECLLREIGHPSDRERPRR